MHGRHILIDDENVVLELEYTPHIGWTLHCAVKHWSKEVYKHFLTIWAELLDVLQDMNIDVIYIYAHSGEPYKFANMFGFAPTDRVGITHSGTEVPLWEYKING